MQGFEDVTMRWDGADYVIPATKGFDLCLEIETIIMNGGSTPAFILLMGQKVPYSVIAKALAAALRMGGARVTAQEIYLAMHEELAGGDGSAAMVMTEKCIEILSMLSPPIAAKFFDGGEADKKK